MVLTSLGRRVFGSLLALPLLWYIGYFDWWWMAMAQQLLVTVTILITLAVCLSPRWPDPSMDPVSAIIMNKEKLLPPGSITHLTIVFYFDDCPEIEKVMEEAKALLEYDRFCSVHVPNSDAIFESSWRRVPVLYEKHFEERKVAGNDEFENVLDDLALRPFKMPVDTPLWKMDILKNCEGQSAIVWRLCHSIGDGIGLVPVGYKFARTLDGKPGKPSVFQPKRGGRKNGQNGVGSLIKTVKSVLKDIKTIVSLANGPFDNCPSINMNHTRKTLAHNGKRARVGMDFKLDDVKVIKQATGYTINDIVVALFAGAVRRYMQKMGDEALKNPEKLKMTGLAPFAQSRPYLPGKVQNKMVFVHFTFPLRFESLSERLKHAHDEFDHLKRSVQVPLLNFVTDVGTKLGLESALSAENTKIWHRTSWIFSNVPGPRERHVLFGKELAGIKPFYCNVIHQAIFFSYAGDFSLALVVDTDSIKEPKLLVKCFQEEMQAAQKIARDMH